MSLSTVRSILLADPTISGIVGTKIFTQYAAKEAQTPFIILEEISQEPNNCKHGISDLDNYTFAVTGVSKRFKEVEDILTAARKALAGYRDDTFGVVHYAGQEDLYDGMQDHHVKTHSYESLIKVL